jgi:RNA polymerase sigma factor (sigma-70 family)
VKFVAGRLRGDEEAAADVAQETWLRVMARWGTVQTHPDPRGYLYKVAKSRIAEYCRKRDQERELVKKLGPLTVDGHEETERVCTELGMAQAFERLTDQEQDAMRRRYGDEQSIQQMARELGLSESGVYKRLARAKGSLGEEME